MVATPEAVARGCGSAAANPRARPGGPGDPPTSWFSGRAGGFPARRRPIRDVLGARGQATEGTEEAPAVREAMRTPRGPVGYRRKVAASGRRCARGGKVVSNDSWVMLQRASPRQIAMTPNAGAVRRASREVVSSIQRYRYFSRPPVGSGSGRFFRDEARRWAMPAASVPARQHRACEDVPDVEPTVFSLMNRRRHLAMVTRGDDSRPPARAGSGRAGPPARRAEADRVGRRRLTGLQVQASLGGSGDLISERSGPAP
jgi:hypothetical protein